MLASTQPIDKRTKIFFASNLSKNLKWNTFFKIHLSETKLSSHAKREAEWLVMKVSQLLCTDGYDGIRFNLQKENCD
jgi:hypothetical protein